ncbi:MAG: papain-like cysteine protease family protein [Thiobacillus sp.]|nr:papain-like cysteine protease family protein [Thiobacillus sp.]
MSTKLTRRSVLIAGIGAMLSALAPVANAEPIGISGFSKYARKQLTPVWCWAAVLQTLLNYRGIQWTQPDIVAAIKGHVTIETASDHEISKFLNSWGFNYNGMPWKSRSLYSVGSPSPELSVSEFSNQRPIVLKFRVSPNMDHVVIAYVANVVPKPGSPDQLMSVFYIDPADGEIHMMSGKDYVNRVSGIG